MINISKLYCDQITPGDWLRYGRKGSGERRGEAVPAKASERRPIVVWNITRKCNLQCVHCYNDSGPDKTCKEMSTDQVSRDAPPGRRLKLLTETRSTPTCRAMNRARRSSISAASMPDP